LCQEVGEESYFSSFSKRAFGVDLAQLFNESLW